MAVTPYRPTYWGEDEPVYTKKLNQMTSNDQYLFEQMPHLKYTGYGKTREQGTKILTGAILFTPFTSVTDRTQSFGTFFSTACNPIITFGVVSTFGHLWPLSRGLDTLVPDHRGFICRVYTGTGGVMTKNFYVHWQAVGF